MEQSSQSRREQDQQSSFPPHMLEKWPELDPLKLKTSSDDEELKLMTYRYPCPEGVHRKGIVFYVHGWGGYSERVAYQYKVFAESGYEVIAYDQRGFGNSEGIRGFFEKAEHSYNDLYLVINKSITQYKVDLQRTPLFIVGRSFGGCLTFNFTLQFPYLIHGMALVVPFFEAYTPNLKRLRHVFKICDIFSPFMQVDIKRKPPAEQYAKFPWVFDDPKTQDIPRAQTYCMFNEQHDYAFKNARNQSVPFLIITAKKDTAVKNSASFDIFQTVNNPKNKFVEMENSDHNSCAFVYDEGITVAKQCVQYFDSLLQ